MFAIKPVMEAGREMAHVFFDKARELLDQNTPFAMAVVVRAEKPTSGRPGDKALITVDGAFYGWIGGSCSQPTVIREALKALKEGKSRFIRLSPDPQALAPRDGLIDFPITCFSGGTLEIYIEPQYPEPRLLVVGTLPIARTLVALGKVMNYDVVVVDPDGQTTGESDQVVTRLPDIAHHIRPETYVVVATHGNFDEAALEHVLKAKPRYIGLVASRKRFEAVAEYLKAEGIDEGALKQIRVPAGLDIHAQKGDEIALSILAEIVQVRRTAQTADDWSSPTSEAMTVPAAETGPATADLSGVAIDPVCHMEVEMATAKYTYAYAGKMYYFCAPDCKRSFSKNPLEYLQPETSTAIDPVCGMEVDTASAEYTSDYQGTTYYFCAAGCKESFDQKPEAYLTVKHQS
jgi:xanthine dehydrogenase accessory factor